MDGAMQREIRDALVFQQDSWYQLLRRAQECKARCLRPLPWWALHTRTRAYLQLRFGNASREGVYHREYLRWHDAVVAYSEGNCAFVADTVRLYLDELSGQIAQLLYHQGGGNAVLPILDQALPTEFLRWTAFLAVLTATSTLESSEGEGAS